MVSLYELADPIQDNQLEELREPLENLQGNILRAHGRDHAVHVFLRFKDTKVKQWIKELAKDITSAQQQLDEAEHYRQYGIPGRLFMSFLLSASGYEYLGLSFPKTPPPLDDEAFPSGMKKARWRLHDPATEDWEKEYRGDIHAMIMLADDDKPFLLRKTRELLDKLVKIKEHAEICTVEHGRVMRNAQEEPVEHFGFADSRSQPLFFQREIERERKEEGTNVWQPGPGAGPALVLVPDPYGRKQYDSNGLVKYHDSGSYLVFRKLEQKVSDFKRREKELAEAIGLTGEDEKRDEKRAGALIMGRFEDGTPVIRQYTVGQHAPVPNNFTYDHDPDGQRCPLQAHIRKVNPRTKRIGRHRIVRRGITYGTRKKEPKDKPSLEELPSQGVGLLFMCYQRNIKYQFEFLQRWANTPDNPSEGTGIDPVIGQPNDLGASQQKWPAQWGDPREKHQSFVFQGFVTLKGGEYFFAPSIAFLSNICNIGER